MVMAVMAHFFPAPAASDLYCNKPSEYDRVTKADTFSSLVSKDLLGKLHSTGDFSLIFELLLSLSVQVTVPHCFSFSRIFEIF